MDQVLGWGIAGGLGVLLAGLGVFLGAPICEQILGTGAMD